MNEAGKALSELFRVTSDTAAVSNSRILEDIRTGGHNIDEYYLLDRLGDTPHGTSLHRLVASHLCTPDALEAFLGHARDASYTTDSDARAHENHSRHPRVTPPSVRHQNCRGATALHVSVYRNPMRLETIIQQLLEWDVSQPQSTTSLASIPMDCGSYPLHVMAGQNLTINAKALQLLADADPSVILKEDVNGDNVLSLLWKNTLRFRWAISIMEGATFIEYMDNKHHKACSWMTVITPTQFLQYSALLMRRAMGKETGITMHELCSLPRCSPMLLMMALSPQYNDMLGIQGDVHTLDEEGKLPLHHAVQSLAVQYKCVPDYLCERYRRSLVHLLLERYPEGACVKDNHGRLPLHYALENGCLYEQDLIRLVHLYPDAMRAQDPVSSLYPFMLVAPPSHARQHCTDAPCSPFATRTKQATQCEDDNHTHAADCASNHRYMEWKKDHVRVSFLLLSLCPEALQYHQRGIKNESRGKECSSVA
jgi:hypothetical protein